MSGVSSDAAHRLGIQNALICACEQDSGSVPLAVQNGGYARANA
jgi:hypothetical protein